MLSSENLKNLFSYNLFANTQMLDQLKATTAPDNEKALKLMAHVLNAQEIWNSRLAGRQQPYGPWQEHTLENMLQQLPLFHHESLRLIETIDLSKGISYVNSQGNNYTNSASDILFHVINHSTYHRAQIATELKRLGLTPPATDYIFYKR